MSKLTVDDKSIIDLFGDKKTYFLIPDYQRPYAWGDEECQTLWDDIFAFAFPGEDKDAFNSDDEYFLGPIVTYKNDNNQLEVIDGQQRLTTIMLLLRAFYARYKNQQDQQSKSTKEQIQKCIWKTDEFGKPDMDSLKIDSEVATDDDKNELISILKTGVVDKDSKSVYARNYRFFEAKIQDFLDNYSGYFSYLPIRILNNCILLPIEAESQETALRIISTLNDRGKPLSDSDIFKAKLYKFYKDLDKKDEFIKSWKDLEKVCDEVFKKSTGRPIDEIFTRYMYYHRALNGNKSTTTEALRKFYDVNSGLLNSEQTMEDLLSLANFWKDVEIQEQTKFTEPVLKKLSILRNAPNSMWTYFVSVYYMTNKDKDGYLDNDSFFEFLNLSISFIFTYAVTNPGVNSLRNPIFSEMLNVVQKKPVTFSDYKFDGTKLMSQLNNFSFNNSKPITRSMVTWWAYENENQELLSANTPFDIEHIYARKRHQISKLNDSKNLDVLGNKSLLERRINIRASDYRFEDKKKYYLGFKTENGQVKEGTAICELVEITNNADFTEDDIIDRNKLILESFVNYVRSNNLIDE